MGFLKLFNQCINQDKLSPNVAADSVFAQIVCITMHVDSYDTGISGFRLNVHPSDNVAVFLGGGVTT